MEQLLKNIQAYDERRDIMIPGDPDDTVRFAVEHFFHVAEKAIKEKGFFSVALSGGSTPKAIYREIAKTENKKKLDWNKVLVFWSDERSVAPTDQNSNYHMAMEAGFDSLSLPPENIFRMVAEDSIEENAKAYEANLAEAIPTRSVDLIMLGMGDDGHTASLFPKTHGLHTNQRLIIANYVPHLETWRMTMTFDCINSGANIALYVIGNAKAKMVKKVFEHPLDPDQFPVQKVGTPTHKALWIMDTAAASELTDL